MEPIQKPVAGEYLPYTSLYIDLVPADGLVIQHLQNNMHAVKASLLAQPEAALEIPCAAGEWTVKDILVHLIDTERIFAYRALRFARQDTTDLAGFDQDLYAAHARANTRPIADILEEYTSVRMASIALFKSFDEATVQSVGISNNHPLSVRAAIYQTAGHELYHVQSIQENYGIKIFLTR